MKNIENFKFWKQGINFLGTTYPIISGAMTWISDSKLVQSVGDAGGLGVLAAGNMPLDILEKEIDILKKNNVQFAVNLITLAPNYLDHLNLAVKKKSTIYCFCRQLSTKE